jgi:predicted signal transduction protein with EAL and GGDEF domain
MAGAVGLTHKLHRSRLGPPKATSRDQSFRPCCSSAITYLTIFPVEKIKIDKSFIKNALALHIALNSPLAQASRSLNFWILPDPVSGNASTMIQCLGVLCGASEARM